MKRQILLSLCLGLIAHSAAADESTPQAVAAASSVQGNQVPTEVTKTVLEIRYQLGSVKDVGTIRDLFFDSVHTDPVFSREIIAALTRAAPREMKAALASAGNIQNPKVLALRKHFEKAFLSTPTIAKISSDLASHGLVITGTDYEKLMLTQVDGEKRVFCFLWLKL